MSLKRFFFFIVFTICLHFPILVYAVPFDSIHTNIQEINKPSIEQETKPNTMIFEATAYCIEDGNGDGVTATGKIPKEGRTVAVDPSIIPYGSKLIIDGVGGYIAEDTGGAIRGNRLDIFVDSYEKAMVFGRRNVMVEIKEDQAVGNKL